MNCNSQNNNAVIYTRFSSQSQDKQTTEVQLKACREYAEKNGYNVIAEYSDEACTGRNFNRPKFKKMLKHLEDEDIKYVIVYKYDRFARNTRLSLNYVAELESLGVTTISTIEPFSNDANGILMRGMHFLISEFYSNDYAQRIKKGLENSASKCQPTGGKMLGFRTVNKQYVIEEKEAIAVKKIFEMYADGKCMATIIDYLNKQGFRTVKGNEFNKNSLHHLLKNKRYIGTYIYKDIEVPNKIPRIVSDELFYKVQERMAANKQAPARARAKTEYLLTTKLYCGHCKSAMVGTSGTSKNKTLYTYYICKNAKDKLCDKKAVSKDFIENTLVEYLRKFLTDKNIEKIANNVVKLFKQQQDKYVIKQLQTAINKNRTKINNLVSTIADTPEESVRKHFVEEISKLEKETNGLERELAKEQKKELNITVDNIKFFLTDLRNGYVDTLKYRKTLINALVNRIYLYDNNMIVIINTQNKDVEIDLPTLFNMEEVLIRGDMLHQGKIWDVSKIENFRHVPYLSYLQNNIKMVKYMLCKI